MAKLGRKPLAGVPRKEVVGIRLTPVERRLLEKRAGSRGLSLTAEIRRSLRLPVLKIAEKNEVNALE